MTEKDEFSACGQMNAEGQNKKHKSEWEENHSLLCFRKIG